MDDDEQESNGLYNPRRLVRAHLIRLSVDQMHQNGRDTHIRQVQLYGPFGAPNEMTNVKPKSFKFKASEPGDGGTVEEDDDDDDLLLRHRDQEDVFQTEAMQVYSTIR